MKRNNTHNIITILDDNAIIELDKLGGLKVEDFQEAAKANFLAQASCTANDAPTASGFIGWNASVRTLRDILIPRGWVGENIKNSPRIIDEENNISIMVATGNEATGNPILIPRTKSNKGVTAKAAVRSNNVLANLFPENEIPHLLPVTSVGQYNKLTLVFLVNIYIDHTSDIPKYFVRSELSEPIGMDDSGYITSWKKRIILPEITIGSEEPISENEEFAPEQEIILQRKV